MPADLSHSIDALRVLAVHGPQGAMHAVHARRHDHKVNMIRHQAIREDPNPVTSGIGVQQAEIRLGIPIPAEDAFAMIATLRDVVWHAGEHDSGTSWHD